MMAITEIRIAVIGLGYVGLPLAVEFSKHFSVSEFSEILRHNGHRPQLCTHQPNRSPHDLEGQVHKLENPATPGHPGLALI